MFVFAIQGSPRKNGNTAYLVKKVIAAWEHTGAETRTLHIRDARILPCTEDTVCEKRGFCPIDDEMEEIFGLLRRADVVILAAPVFFYSFPAQCKSLIDRCQVLWSRKYRLGLKDPGAAFRKGILCSVGATKGANLFDGMKLTAAYFFDALGSDFTDSLVYRQVEHPGDLAKVYDVTAEAAELVRRAAPAGRMQGRIVFRTETNSSAACAASVLLRQAAGDRFDSAVLAPVLEEEERKLLVSAFAEEGTDVEFYPFPVISSAEVRSGDTVVELPGSRPDLTPAAFKKTLRAVKKHVNEIVS